MERREEFFMVRYQALDDGDGFAFLRGEIPELRSVERSSQMFDIDYALRMVFWWGVDRGVEREVVDLVSQVLCASDRSHGHTVHLAQVLATRIAYSDRREAWDAVFDGTEMRPCVEQSLAVVQAKIDEGQTQIEGLDYNFRAEGLARLLRDLPDWPVGMVLRTAREIVEDSKRRFPRSEE